MTVSKTPPGIGTAFRNFDYEREIARLQRSGGGSGGGGTGPAGPPGPTGYDTAPIGAIISTTRSTWSNEYVLANGQSLIEANFPDALAAAVAEVAAGNPLWTVTGSAPNRSFTVPDLRNRFIYGGVATAASGYRTLGTLSVTTPLSSTNLGEESHTLTSVEAAQKAVSTGIESAGHTHKFGTWGGLTVTAGAWKALNGDLGNLDDTGPASNNHTHAIAGSAATTAHNNMPPYAVLVFLVKVKGVSTSATTITGPTGAQGPSGAAGAVGATGAAGPGVPVGGTTGQALVKKTATDYDTEWGAAVGGSGSPEIYIGPNPPPSTQVLWIDTDEQAWTAPQRVTSLPVSVYDGLEVYWQVDAGPPAVVWHMRWNNTTFRWECLGGNPISFRMDGEYNGYSAFASGTNITVNAAQNKALQWNINLPVDLWVEVTFSIGVVQKLDAAYHYAIFSTMVSGAVAIGTPHQILRTQHASVNTYEPYFLRSRLGLSANTNYAIYCQTAIQGGSWQFNQNSTYLSLVGSAWPR